MGWSTSSDPLAPKKKSNSRGGPKVLFTAGFLPILNNFMSSGRREGGDLKLIPSRCTFLRSAQSPLDQVWATHTQVCFGGPFQLRFKERYCSTMGQQFYTESRLRSVGRDRAQRRVSYYLIYDINEVHLPRVFIWFTQKSLSNGLVGASSPSFSIIDIRIGTPYLCPNQCSSGSSISLFIRTAIKSRKKNARGDLYRNSICSSPFQKSLVEPKRDGLVTHPLFRLGRPSLIH